MITQVEKNLNNVFDLEQPIEVVPKDLTPNLPATVQENLPAGPDDRLTVEERENEEIKSQTTEDYDLARNNIKTLIDQGSELLDTAISIANSTEDPKAIASASAVLKNLADINKSLLDMAKQKQDVIKNTRVKAVISSSLNSDGTPNAQTNIQNITNNVVFSGTGADLLKMIKQVRDEAIEGATHDEKTSE